MISAYPGLQTVSGAPVALSVNEITQLVTMSADDVDFATAAPPYGPANNTKVKTRVAARRDPARSHRTRLRPDHGVRPDRRGPSRRMDSFRSHPTAGRDRGYALVPGSFTVSAVDGLGPDRNDAEPSWRYEVQVAPGEAPAQSAWRVVERGSGHGVSTGTLARIPLGRVAALFPESVHLDGSPALADGQPDPDSTCSPSGSSSRTPPGWSEWPGGPSSYTRTPPCSEGPSRNVPARSPHHRFWHPSDREGPTRCWWRPRTEPSTPTALTVRSLRAGPCTPLRTPGYHPGEEAYTSRAVTAVPRGELIGGLAVGDLADANGHALDVVATDLTGRVWAWNATASCSPDGRLGPTPPSRAPVSPTPTTRY